LPSTDQNHIRNVDRNITLPSDLRTIADGLDHPEAICWCPKSRSLYAGGEHGQIYRVEPEAGKLELIAQISGGFILGLAVDGDGNLYACDIGNQCIHRVAHSGAVSRYAGPISYPNSLAFDADGRLYASDSGLWESNGNGSIVCIERDGSVSRLTAPTLRFPNGIAIRDDWLYIVESSFPGISKVPLYGGDPIPVIELPLTIPDGIAFDVDGGLWIACWQPNRILHLSAAGELSTVADDWSGIHILTPNNVAFFGVDLKDLVLSSLGGNFLRQFRPHVAGAPLHYPRVSG
jgi:sugar lactone lactonase YvrE